ncbi:hypothetical protein HX004_02730 [Myroides sp. 1354]|uniref:hypothetical protein n=1 Tax=unclassified Myroides TaxID=2642485 RepID=UPI002575722A|nr:MULTISPECIES: hypothetical protein [unclassified Myroides]MDM1043246.1 hypothetical protein [Myroides sp. R163-1]MDM1054701.1 hypothetical protein [Myroides sp. 1354]MDM1067998.1 hypothetical protein [Myroides sp. 1372]
MKKIISLSILLLAFSVSYGQKKPVIQSSSEVIVYKDIENILQNKAELGLTQKQEASFIVKNEYIKRDLQALNDRTDMLPVEKKETEKKVKNTYQLFIQRTLTKDQMDIWAQKKVEFDLANIHDEGLKADLKALDAIYKADQKEIYRKYGMDRTIYAAQKNTIRKKYETERLKLMQYYNATEVENDVMSLEEIANLVKEFDDYYSGEASSNPLKYLNIRENTTSEGEAEESTYTEEPSAE